MAWKRKWLWVFVPGPYGGLVPFFGNFSVDMYDNVIPSRYAPANSTLCITPNDVFFMKIK